MTADPEFLIEGPDRYDPRRLSSDPLSTVLEAVRLKGAIYFLADLARPWVAEAPRASVLAPLIMPGVQHLIEYHVVTRGELWGGLPGEKPVKVGAGDVIIFPQGDAHVLSSAPGMRQPPDLAMFARKAGDSLPLRIGGAGPDAGETQVVCGFLGCDARPFNPLLATLPRLLHVRHSAHKPNAALHMLVELALAESRGRGSGSAAMLARMSELLFVESVRNYLRELTPEDSGWLAGLRDPLVGRALAELHAQPRRAWTLDGLARASSTSRSVLAERFAHYVGQPPMQYLARWRMQLAASALLEGNPTVADVATRVGYGSEAAFSRAFKKQVGVSPAAWRESNGQPAAGASPRKP